MCPTCGADAGSGPEKLFGEIKHQLDLLVPSDQIKPYRWKILNLLPEFGSHPVFLDVRPTVEI